MSFQGTLNALIGAFITFCLACAAVGRPDIPFRLVTELRAKSMAGTTPSWGCPSVFHKESCVSYNPARYKTRGKPQ